MVVVVVVVVVVSVVVIVATSIDNHYIGQEKTHSYHIKDEIVPAPGLFRLNAEKCKDGHEDRAYTHDGSDIFRAGLKLRYGCEETACNKQAECRHQGLIRHHLHVCVCVCVCACACMCV